MVHESSNYSRASLSRLTRLVRKELLEIVRDRRTILTLVLMPLLLYPLLSIAFQQFFLASSIDPNRGMVYRLGFASGPEMQVFFQFLQYGDHLLFAESKRQDAAPPKKVKSVGKVVDDLGKAVREGEVDLGVTLKDAARFRLPLAEDMELKADVQYATNNPAALGALAYVERHLAAVHEKNLEARLYLPEVPEKVALLRLSRTALVVAGGDSMISLAALVPLILILMTITGAVYPAIDLTAGERERGTLEILMAAPVPRLGLLFAKYVSVFTVAVMTALVNLVAMIFTLVFSGLSHVLFADGGLTPVLVVQLFGLLLLFAAFFSAVLLSLTSFARSFKEAQAYLIPLMLASLAPGLIGMMPGLELDGPLAVAPLVNIVLLARDLVKGEVDPSATMVVVLSTLVYAAAAIALAARVFGAEGVLYNEQSGWTDLLRRPNDSQHVATISGALWCLVMMVPLHAALQWTVRLADPWLPPAWLIISVGVVGVLLFGVLPAFSAYMGRVNPWTGFGLTPARPAALFGGLVLGLSLWPIVLKLLEVALSERAEGLKTLVEAQLPALNQHRYLLVAILVVQAILEELTFRGYVFGALRQRCSGPLTIGISALLFGGLHVVLGGALGWERLLPSTLLGLVLGWVCWTSGSVLPGLILHACHNALLQLLPATQNLSWQWVLAGTAASSMGAVLVYLGRKPADVRPALADS